MTTTFRKGLLRAHALYIGTAGTLGLVFDIRGVLTGLGPQGQVLADAPYAGIGFIEAHGLAIILSVVLWRAAPIRSAHLTALATALLLGTANIAFWQLFVATDALVLGYLTTGLHWAFAALQGAAAARPGQERVLQGSAGFC
jgi:hypothetical protein